MSKDIFDQNISRLVMQNDFNSPFKIDIIMEPLQFEYLPGDRININVKITNVSSYTIHKIILVENPQVEGIFTEFPIGTNLESNQLSYITNSLLPLETKCIKSVYVINEDVIPGLYQFRYVIGSSNYGSNEQIFNINIKESVSNAKITLEKSVSSLIVNPDDQIEFNITITNESDVDAYHLIMIDNNNLPGNYTLFAEDATYIDGILTYHIPFLEKRKSITKKLPFKVAARTNLGYYFNSVLVRTKNAEEVTDVITVQVIDKPKINDTSLELNYYVENLTLHRNQEFEIIYTIKNIGTTTVNHVSYNNHVNLPGNFISIPKNGVISSKQLSGIIPMIASGEIVSLKIMYKISSDAMFGLYQNTLSINSDNANPLVSDLKFQIVQNSIIENANVKRILNKTCQIHSDKICSNSPIKITQIIDKKDNHYQNGDTITFLTEITNISSKVIVKNIQIIDTIDLPGFFKIKPCQTNDYNMHTYNCHIGDLLPGQTFIAATKYVIQTDDSGVYQNKIEVTSDNVASSYNVLDIYVGL